MSTEIHTFDPSTIQTALDRDLPNGLRMLADALEAKQIDGWLISAQGRAGAGPHDTRAHVLVKINLAAQVFTRKVDQKLPLPAPGLGLPKGAA